MSLEDKRTDASAREEAATEWVCERAAGFAPGRAGAFAAWLAANPQNVLAVREVERTLALLDNLPAVQGVLAEKYDAIPVAGATKVRPFIAARPFWMAALAAVFVVAAIGTWLTGRSESGERFLTADQVQQRVALADGSVVDLNAASDVTVAFSAAQRSVTLAMGEAHFAVAHDPARPFVVSAGGVSVRAVGTAFNVQLAGGAVDVVVTEGEVEVRRGTGGRAAARLTAGERTRVDVAARPVPLQVEKLDPMALRTRLAWQQRLTSFNDVPLRELVARFNRHNSTRLVLEDPALGERRLGGIFALDQVEAFVRLLEDDGDILADRRRAEEIVLRRAP